MHSWNKTNFNSSPLLWVINCQNSNKILTKLKCQAHLIKISKEIWTSYKSLKKSSSKLWVLEVIEIEDQDKSPSPEKQNVMKKYQKISLLVISSKDHSECCFPLKNLSILMEKLTRAKCWVLFAKDPLMIECIDW